MSFVSFENVSKVYGSGLAQIKAVDGITFAIEKGEFCVIVGPSGAGKTTVLNMLGGMDSCSSGLITVDGTAVSGMNRKQLTSY
ncbi:MAG: ATP-binding cassette domain-containing protein, partial [Firmicutes bacterium]|nr:ATP-binding cassette domain-containing protein [Bacillota bacterium]